MFIKKFGFLLTRELGTWMFDLPLIVDPRSFIMKELYAGVVEHFKSVFDILTMD